MRIIYKIFISAISLLFFAFSISPLLVRIDKKPTKAYTSETILIGGDFDFDSADIDFDSFTPFDSDEDARMMGNSWAPVKSPYNSGTVSTFFYEKQRVDFDSTDLDGTKSISFWVYFDGIATRNHIFYLFSGENYISWTIDADKMVEYFARKTPSALDITVYVPKSSQTDSDVIKTHVPYGWNKIELAIKDGVPSSGAINPSVTNGFDGFGFEQELYRPEESGETVLGFEAVGETEVLIYNLSAGVATSGINKIVLHGAQDNVIFNYYGKNSTISFSHDYYAGEYFEDIPTFAKFFGVTSSSPLSKTGYMWVGKTDFSKYSAKVDYEKLFDVVILDPSNESVLYKLGSGGPVLTQGIYFISFVFNPNALVSGTSRVDSITLNSYEIRVSSYGQGIWFIDNNIDANVGETRVIRYKIHDAFYENNFSNEVSVSFEKEGVLELVEHDKNKKTITVKVVGEGTSAIILTLTSGRLEYRSNGLGGSVSALTNDSFKIVATTEVVQDNNTMKILLWVSLGLICGSGLAYGIYTLVKSRKIEVN